MGGALKRERQKIVGAREAGEENIRMKTQIEMIRCTSSAADDDCEDRLNQKLMKK